jgi:hypothetical protein
MMKEATKHDSLRKKHNQAKSEEISFGRIFPKVKIF